MDESLTPAEAKALDKKLARINLVKLTYKDVLSRKPSRSVIRHHKYGNFDYLPITAIERMLDGLFESWNVEILREGTAVNGFYVVVRLTAILPDGSHTKLTADGIGFAEFQTTKGAAPTDFTKLQVGAGVLAVPKAKTEAVKNAAKQFGNLFGRNLARSDEREVAETDQVNSHRKVIANTLRADDEN